MSVEERRDRYETEGRYERGVVDLTDGGGATASGTMQDRLESDQVLRRVKGVLDIRVRTAAGIDVQNGYPAAWRIRCPVLLDQLRIEKERGSLRVLSQYAVDPAILGNEYAKRPGNRSGRRFQRRCVRGYQERLSRGEGPDRSRGDPAWCHWRWRRCRPWDLPRHARTAVLSPGGY